MDSIDTLVKMAIYHHFAETGRRPSIDEVANRAGVDVQQARDSYRSLGSQRLLVLESDQVSIRMAPPFSGVATLHQVESDGIHYDANCAWDALGIVAALHRPGIVHSRCAQSGEPLHLDVGRDGPGPSSWWFHCLVPAAKWWDDVVFT
jgi:alkylmercury lyase-like protein